MFDTGTFERIEGTADRRSWSTVASFSLQVMAVGALLVFPLLHPETLPIIRYAEKITAPTAPRAPESVEIVSTQRQERISNSEIYNDHLIEPTTIPTETHPIVDPVDFRSNSSDAPSVPFAPPGTASNSDSAITRLLTETRPTVRPALSVASRGPLPISHLDEGALVRKVQPIYPPIAKQTRTQGNVILAAVIDRDGHITSLKAVSGHPLLIPAAVDAVKQWRYRPYILNGQAIEVETQITVSFTLQ